MVFFKTLRMKNDVMQMSSNFRFASTGTFYGIFHEAFNTSGCSVWTSSRCCPSAGGQSWAWTLALSGPRCKSVCTCCGSPWVLGLAPSSQEHGGTALPHPECSAAHAQHSPDCRLSVVSGSGTSLTDPGTANAEPRGVLLGLRVGC